MTLGVGDYAQARYEFQGDSPGDLSLDVGDVVKITDTVDQNWLVGEKVGQEAPPLSGSFPAAFVEHLSLPSVRTGQKIFLAVQEFLAEQTGDLELAKGDVITGLEAVDECWWRGKNGPLKGIFPLSFVVELWHDDGLRSRSYSARAGSLKSRSGSLAAGSRSRSIGGFDETGAPGGGGGSSLDASITKVTEPTFARALVDVSPQLDGELAFLLGDLIEITEIIDDDWFFGRCHNKEGLVSAVCVELLDDGGTSDTGEGRGGGGGSEPQSLPQVPLPPLQEERQLQGPGRDGNDDAYMDSEAYRLRNASSASYTTENTRSHDAEILPYARVIYPFVAASRSELSLEEGQIVTLVRHLDSEWTQGEMDGRRGIFPTDFVDIVVDCPHGDAISASNTQNEPIEGYMGHQDLQPATASSLASSDVNAVDDVTLSGSYNHEQSSDSGAHRKVNADVGVSINKDNTGQEKEAAKEEAGDAKTRAGAMEGDTGISAGISEVFEVSEGSEIGLVLHTFQAEVDGDVSVSEGDTVEVLRQVDADWLQVRTEAHRTGLIPRNHVELIGLWPKGQQPPGGVGSSDAPAVVAGGVNTRRGHHTLGRSVGAVTPEQKSFTTPKQSWPRFDINSQKASTINEDLTPTRPVSKEPPALPAKKPSLPPKPALAPKPALKPKPPMSGSKPARPPALITAKPFSSLPRAKPHHVVSPTERRLSLSSLDSIIEGEMEKAKSRSSSQTSDNVTEQNSSELVNTDALGSAVLTDQNLLSNVSTSAASTSHSLLEGQSLQGSLLQTSDSLISASASPDKKSETSLSEASKNQNLCFEDNFSVSPAITNSYAQGLSSTPSFSSATTSERPPLTSSLSLSEERHRAFQEGDQRRKSTSFAGQRSNGKISAIPSAAPQEDSQASFVNKAFVMEVDEGKLVDVAGDHQHPAGGPPKRTPPGRPASTVLPSLLSTKNRAPPPRPDGPRIAPAPPKVPLEPTRAAPALPTAKLVPKRPAPRAPGSAPQTQPTNLNNSHSSKGTSIAAETNMALPAATPMSGQPISKPATTVARPAPKPPARQPPRPVSLATPPPRAPPPRPTDLIAFSPEEPNEPQAEADISEETKKEMVKDLKAKLEENKADIKPYPTRG